jgi:PAS domain S-box-containing protein
VFAVHEFSLPELVDLHQVEQLLEVLCRATGVPVRLLNTEGSVVWGGEPPAVPAGEQPVAQPVLPVFCAGVKAAVLQLGPVRVVAQPDAADGADDLPAMTREALDRACDHYENFADFLAAHIAANLKNEREARARRRIAEALRTSRERFRTAFQTSPDAICITRVDDGVFVEVNDGFSHLTGYSRSQVLGRSVFDVGIWAQEAERQELFRMLEADGFVRNMEAVFRMKDGSERTGLISARVVDMNDAAHVLSVTRDIEDRKRAERALRRSEQRYRRLFEGLSDAAFVADPQSGLVVDTNYRAELLLATGREDIIGMSFADLYAPDDREMALAALQTAAANPITREVEMNVQRPDGSCIPVAGSGTTVEMDEGRRVVFLCRDQTDRIMAQEAMRIRDAAMGAVLAGLVLATLDGEITYVNRECLRMWGYEQNVRMVGRFAWEFWQDREAARRMLQTVQEKGRWMGEMTALRSDGTPMPVLGTATVVHDEAGEPVCIVGSFLDITERRHNEDLLQRTVEDLSRSNTELERFAYVASHDLQEPLRNVTAYVQMLQRRYENKLDEDADEFIGYAVAGARRMRALIRDLLEYSRVSARAKPFGPTDLNALLRGVVEDLKVQVAEANARITYDELPEARVDAVQFRQLLENLLANGLKFRGQAPARIHLGCQEQDREWVFSVRDNGIGIDPAHAEQIFVIYERLHSDDEIPGTGIGLALCKKIVERHGGRIWVESAPGEGSTFYFTIPRHHRAAGQ